MNPIKLTRPQIAELREKLHKAVKILEELEVELTGAEVGSEDDRDGDDPISNIIASVECAREAYGDLNADSEWIEVQESSEAATKNRKYALYTDCFYYAGDKDHWIEYDRGHLDKRAVLFDTEKAALDEAKKLGLSDDFEVATVDVSNPKKPLHVEGAVAAAPKIHKWVIDWRMVDVETEEAPDGDHDIESYSGHATVNGKKEKAWGNDEQDGFQMDIDANVKEEIAKILGVSDDDPQFDEWDLHVINDGVTTVEIVDGKVKVKNSKKAKASSDEPNIVHEDSYKGHNYEIIKQDSGQHYFSIDGDDGAGEWKSMNDAIDLAESMIDDMVGTHGTKKKAK